MCSPPGIFAQWCWRMIIFPFFWRSFDGKFLQSTPFQLRKHNKPGNRFEPSTGQATVSGMFVAFVKLQCIPSVKKVQANFAVHQVEHIFAQPIKNKWRMWPRSCQRAIFKDCKMFGLSWQFRLDSVCRGDRCSFQHAALFENSLPWRCPIITPVAQPDWQQ